LSIACYTAVYSSVEYAVSFLPAESLIYFSSNVQVNYEDVVAKFKRGSNGNSSNESSNAGNSSTTDDNSGVAVAAASTGNEAEAAGGAASGAAAAAPPLQRPSYWDSLKDGYLSEKMAAVRAARMREAARQGNLGAQEEVEGEEGAAAAATPSPGAAAAAAAAAPF